MLLARNAVVMEDLDQARSLDFFKWDLDGFLVAVGSVESVRSYSPKH